MTHAPLFRILIRCGLKRISDLAKAKEAEEAKEPG